MALSTVVFGPSKRLAMAGSITRAATSGVIWLMASSLGGRSAMFAGQLVLARLLLPSDFGVVGLASTVTAVFSMLGNVGIEQVLQQRRSRMRLWTQQAFWISLVLACIVGLAMPSFAPIAGRLYHNASIVPLVWIAAPSLPLSALCTVPRAYLQAAMRFRFLSTYALAELVTQQALTVLLAWLGFGAASFVLPVPLLAAVRASIFWRVAPVRFASLAACRYWRLMLWRGAAVLGSQVYSTVIDQGDYVILGLFAQVHTVGIYYFAYKLAAQPMRMIAINVSAVLFPALNAVGEDRARQREAALTAAELMGIIAAPVCFLQAAAAAPAIPLLFGQRWAGAIPFLQILSLGLPFDAISWPAGSLLSVRGRFGTMFRYQAAFAPLFYGMVIGGAWIGGAIGVALAVACYAVVHPLAFSVLVFRPEGVRLGRILLSYLAPMTLSAVTIGAAYLVATRCLPDTPIAQIAAIAVLGSTGYVLALRYFLPRSYGNARAIVCGYVGS